MNRTVTSIGWERDLDRESFRNTSSGSLVRITGHDQYLNRSYDHLAFQPANLASVIRWNRAPTDWRAKRDRAVGRLDAAVTRLPNPRLLLRPALRREAVSTSALEGTYATLLEVFEADFIEDRQRTSEQREVLNYVRAAERGIELIAQKPICVTVIDELQAILVRGTRSDGASAGRLRQGQVYIGEREQGIEHARFVPPPAGEILERGIYAWETWLNADDDIPLLIKAAIGHYQFETLHPYTDGNGRLGRLVVALQLVAFRALGLPVLNLSPWLKRREAEYKSLLWRPVRRATSTHGFSSSSAPLPSRQTMRFAGRMNFSRCEETWSRSCVAFVPRASCWTSSKT